MILKENKRALGGVYERMAAEFLSKKGLRILCRNYSTRSGEIDLIARDGEYLVFVEVKYRSTEESGSSVCAVDKDKQRSISRTALHYLTTRVGNMELACRFDVVGIDGEKICWIKNAFDYRKG